MKVLEKIADSFIMGAEFVLIGGAGLVGGFIALFLLGFFLNLILKWRGWDR